MKKSKKTNGRQTAAMPAKKVATPRPPEPTADQIRERAYQIYLRRGGVQGGAIEDWLNAERELRTS